MLKRPVAKFYKQSESLSVDDIVSDIEKEEALEVEEVTITKIVDKPEIPIIILIISLSIMLIIGLVIRYDNKTNNSCCL